MAATGNYIWPPYQAPSHPDKPPATSAEAIRIRNPAYPDSCNTLLSFYPCDDGGVHSETARLACAAITEEEDGHLSEDQEGHVRVDTDPETILRRNSYYFQSGTPGMDYAVTANFDHFRYHGNLPSYWQNMPSFVQASRPPNDMSCRLTQSDYAVENAHLIPTAQRDWFDKNCMHKYTPSTATDKMNHPNNNIRLRRDIHTVFDAKRFAIVPMDGRIVAYCFNEELDSQVARLYHGVELHRLHLSANSVHFLWVRFVYTVFEQLRSYLDSRVPRKLRLRLGDGVIEQICDEDRCQSFARATAGQGKSRSASPKKRQRGQEVEESVDDYDHSSDEEQSRGRKRRRSSELSGWTPSISFGSTRASEVASVTSPERVSIQCKESVVKEDKEFSKSRGLERQGEGLCHS